MKTVKEFLTELGGPKKLGELLGRSPSNITFWGNQGSIPIDHWPKIMDLAHKAQIECTAEILLRMCLNSPKKGETI